MIPNGYKTYIKKQIDEYIYTYEKIPQKTDLKDLAVEPLIFEYGNWRNALIALGYLKVDTPESAFHSLQDLQDTLEGAPSLIEAKEAGIDTKILIQKYGSWKNVKKQLKAHTTKTYKMKKTNQTKFNEKVQKDEEKILELTRNLKKIPTAKDIIDHGIDINRILKKYNTWNNAKIQLHLYEIYEEIVLKDIKDLYIKNEKKPSLSDISNHKINIKPIVSKYGSWSKACTHLNITCFDKEKMKEYILEEMKKQRKLPSLTALKKNGFQEKELLKVYKTWHNAIVDLGLDIEEEKILAEDIQNLCNKLQYIPTIEELKEHGLYSSPIFHKYHGWEKFRENYEIKVQKIDKTTDTSEIEKKLKLVEKILGKMPSVEEAKEFDINVEKLLKKYGTWNAVVACIK